MDDVLGQTYGMSGADNTLIPYGAPLTGGFVQPRNNGIGDSGPDHALTTPVGAWNPMHSFLPWGVGLVVLMIWLNSKGD
jgi:hypothetical protein